MNDQVATLAVIARSETTKQSMPPLHCGARDCFVVSLLASEGKDLTRNI